MSARQWDFKTANSLGFLPRKGEEKEAFLKRVRAMKREEVSIEALARCKHLFDAEPEWVEILEDHKGLSPWQGAVMWTQEDSEGNITPLIQISPRLKKSFLRRWYPKEEVIAHELIHAVRMPLHSLRFEEIIAYHTSQNPVRKYLGPLVRRPYEVYVLLSTLVISWAALLWGVSFFLFLPWAVCLFGILRLIYCQWIFHRCKANLSKVLKDKGKILAFLARLTDEEIAYFAHSSIQDILSYADQAQETQLRWQILLEAYPLIQN